MDGKKYPYKDDLAGSTPESVGADPPINRSSGATSTSDTRGTRTSIRHLSPELEVDRRTFRPPYFHRK